MRSQLDPHPPPPTLPDHRGDGPKKRKRQTTNGTRSTRRQLGRDGEPDLVCCFVESIGIRSRMGSFGGKRSVERLRLRGTRAFGRRDLGTRYPLEGSRRPENFYLGVDYVTSVSHVIIPLSPIDRAYFGPSNKDRLVTPAKSNGHIRLSSDCSLGKGHCSSPSLNEHGEARGVPIGISRQIIGPLLTRGARQRTVMHQRPHVLNNLVRTPLPIVHKEVPETKEERGIGPLRGSPFTQEIQEKPIHESFRLPTLEVYDGSTDPTEHITTFRAQMVLYDTSDTLMCRAFPTVLRGPA
ncbi:hypothetical protein BHM03_00033302 [Ensete ventricosum]|nr:hypothetical protein BHM03_00033302 [Ensete ventricosum]